MDFQVLIFCSNTTNANILNGMIESIVIPFGQNLVLNPTSNVETKKDNSNRIRNMILNHYSVDIRIV